MHSLWLKLVGAFALVILIGGVVDSVLVSQMTSGQFDRYVTESGQAWAQRIAPTVADYYARTGSWQGVEAVLSDPWLGMMGMMQSVERGAQESWPGMTGGMMGRMMGRDSGWQGDWRMRGNDTGWDDRSTMGNMMGGDMWAGVGVRLLLADERGTVVADTASSATGTMLKSTELGAGTPVLVNERQVGTLLAVPAAADVGTPAGDFLRTVNRSTWLAGLAAGAVALALGLLIFRHIIAPVRAVTTAAQHIAAGQLDQRVPVTSRDEIGQLAETFNQMADELDRDQQLRRNMVADIAHELRTPLSVVQANLEAMLDGVLPASPQEIASLHDETVLLTRLVADLRLLSLAEAGQLKLERAETDLGDLLRKVVGRMNVRAQASGVELLTDVALGLPMFNVDADRIGQVIGNLVSNALRYTPTGGRVTVRAALQAQAGDRPTGIIEVADTGSGIAPKDLPFVFDRFYRADKSRSRAGGGSGIGLAIVKYLVEAHGGHVWVESKVGRGTTFTFTLPAV